MLERFVKDQSGMALGLAVVMIVLIGVMGAGLLVFVQSDLEAVVEVNQGRKALEVADAGAQAARVRLLRDIRAAHYDVDDSSTPRFITAQAVIRILRTRGSLLAPAPILSRHGRRRLEVSLGVLLTGNSTSRYGG